MQTLANTPSSSDSGSSSSSDSGSCKDQLESEIHEMIVHQVFETIPAVSEKSHR
jgi:hypothetical protein